MNTSPPRNHPGLDAQQAGPGHGAAGAACRAFRARGAPAPGSDVSRGAAPDPQPGGRGSPDPGDVRPGVRLASASPGPRGPAAGQPGLGSRRDRTWSIVPVPASMAASGWSERATNNAISSIAARTTWENTSTSSGASPPWPAIAARAPLISPRAWRSYRARQRCHPSTEGASISRISWITGSRAIRTHSRQPARSAAAGPGAPAAASMVRRPTSVSSGSSTCGVPELGH